MLAHVEGGIVSQLGSTIKVTMSAHCWYKAVPILFVVVLDHTNIYGHIRMGTAL